MKYIVFSYDDGTIHDIKLVELMNKYNIKGTFNLNSELGNFVWNLDGKDIVRPPLNEIKDIYNNHEVCAHSCTHPYLHESDDERLHHEIYDDKKNLEKIFGREIRGFATPFGSFTEYVLDVIKDAGFEYCRLPETTSSYEHEEDAMHLKVNILTYKDNVLEKIEEFASNGNDEDLCIVAGHSYEYYCNDSWDEIEKVFKRVSELKNVKSVTTYEALEKLNLL